MSDRSRRRRRKVGGSRTHGGGNRGVSSQVSAHSSSSSRGPRPRGSAHSNSPGSNRRPSSLTKGKARRGRIKFGGLIGLCALIGLAVGMVMFLWAIAEVRPLVANLNGSSGSAVSSRAVTLYTPLTSDSDRQISHVNRWPERVNVSQVSQAALVQLLLSLGYSEADTVAPRTFSSTFLKNANRSQGSPLPSGALSITRLSGETCVVSRGKLFTVTQAARDSSAKQLESTSKVSSKGQPNDSSWQPAQECELGSTPLGARIMANGPASSTNELPGALGRRIPLASFSEYIPKAILATEDARFYTHFGIDIIGIARALISNITAGRVVQGGSTLTQQLAKNLFLDADRSLLRKFKELFISLALEMYLSKDKLLELYLNEVYLGAEAGVQIHGVPAAAQWLFNKSADQLSLSESALLAGMIQAPNANNPRRRPTNAEQRRRVALSRMAEAELITAQQFKRALSQPPKIALSGGGSAALTNAGSELGAYIPALMREMDAPDVGWFASREQRNTTISPILQRCAEVSIANGVRDLGRRYRRKSLPQAALVALSVPEREILAYVGGTHFAINRTDYARSTPRQLGSTVKPFVFARALEKGAVQLTSAILDEPLTPEELGNSRAQGWQPQNYDERFRGLVTVRYALENSLNIPAIRLARELGMRDVARTFEAFHLSPSPISPYPALAIGALEGTLLDLVTAYAGLSAGGSYRAASIVPASKAERSILDPRAVFLVTNTLQGVVQRGTAGRALSSITSIALAGKTGTSDSARDVWFAGYTPDVALGVWVGYPDNRSLGTGATGGSIAAPIARSFLECSKEFIPPREFQVPAGVELRTVGDSDSEGGADSESGPVESGVKEFFIAERSARYDGAGVEEN